MYKMPPRPKKKPVKAKKKPAKFAEKVVKGIKSDQEKRRERQRKLLESLD